ncbi:phage portal protein [Xanthobacter tagetidis]|uniref:Phage portal protein n=1 Tax=Xanthobacter tagetidis TaxID=60216 RepID=A0A3L7AK25_9HYPH|nr:phage portal protein [Xanthobacter tagetidis]MBB6307009.1 HK97 family phage portal protein [Xanthobacter tagetidis]RLP79938.1 phage portal protein [Xanthobacter tagetidis]
MLDALLAPFRAHLRAPPARPEAKASRTAALVAVLSAGRPVWSPRDTASLACEGFAKNAIAYRAVRLIGEAAASVPLVLMSGTEELTEHPLLRLMARPNPRLGGAAFMEALCSHLLVAGNAYVEAVALEGRVRELHLLRPDRVRVVPGADGWPEAFDYTLAGRTVRIAQETLVAGADVPPVLHLAVFNPVDDHYGFAPLEAAAQALDLHNASGAWNKALIDNAARPSGALVYGGTGTLTEEQFERLKGELEASFQGAANAGRPLLLEGGLEWRALSLSPKDMDFEAARNGAAREIALAIGVPPLLLGIPGDNTYANYAEANRALWRQSVVPLVRRVADEVSAWLAPAFGADLRLVPDLDQVEALAAERSELWKRIGSADFLTDAEKRAAVGYGETGRQ